MKRNLMAKIALMAMVVMVGMLAFAPATFAQEHGEEVAAAATDGDSGIGKGLIAIGAGLAAGTESLEIALTVTFFFNYVIIVFWELDYGEDVSVDHWFTKSWMNKGPSTSAIAAMQEETAALPGKTDDEKTDQ